VAAPELALDRALDMEVVKASETAVEPTPEAGAMAIAARLAP